MNLMWFELLAIRGFSDLLEGVNSKNFSAPTFFYVTKSLSFELFTVLHACRVGTSIFCTVA